MILDCVRRSSTRSLRPASSEASATISSSIGLAHVVRAGAGHQHASGSEQPQRAEVDLLVASGRTFQAACGIWRKPGDRAPPSKFAARRGIAGQQVEDVRLRRNSMLAIPLAAALARAVSKRAAESCRLLPRDSHSGRQMQRKSAGRGEAVERLAAGIARRRQVVLALIEKVAGLLAVQQIGMEAAGRSSGLRLRPEFRRAATPVSSGSSSFLRTAASLRSDDACGWNKLRPEPATMSVLGAVHALVERLDDEVVAIAVDDQSRAADRLRREPDGRRRSRKPPLLRYSAAAARRSQRTPRSTGSIRSESIRRQICDVEL